MVDNVPVIKRLLQQAFDKSEGDMMAFRHEFDKLKDSLSMYLDSVRFESLWADFVQTPSISKDAGYEVDNDEFDEGLNGVTMSHLTIEGWFNEGSLKEVLASSFGDEVLSSGFDLNGEVRIDVLRHSAHILTRLNNPLDWGNNKNGLVYGMVQSGKTNSMLALTAMAFYAGYDLVIVLTTNSVDLRNQTQARFRKVFGLDQGVRECGGFKVVSKTEVDDKIPAGSDPYDYYSGATLAFGSTPYKQFLVLKKEPRTLEKYVRTLEEFVKRIGDNGTQPKFLILDDEADHSSLNTKKQGASKISQCISDLANVLRCVDYVAYTATPQGCIAADVNARVGYPRDFIWVLEPYLPRHNGQVLMGTYVGGFEVFQKYPNRVCQTIPEDDWPLHSKDSDGTYNGVYSQVDDGEDKSLKEAESDYVDAVLSNRIEVPSSMVDMLLDFMLGGGVRWHRWFTQQKQIEDVNDVEHQWPRFACLFNPTYITDTQMDYSKVVQLAWSNAKEEYAAESKQFLRRVRQQEKFSQSVSRSFEWNSELKGFIDLFIREVERNIFIRDPKTQQIRNTGEYVYVLNSLTPFNLDYTKIDQTAVKRGYIVIGGNKLSRGLTIEGLATAYYGRTQRVSLADTVTQMARWFGHKAAYLDLIRVYLHSETFEAFREISYEDLRLRLSVKQSILNGDSPDKTLYELRHTPLWKATNPSKSRNLKSSGLSDYARNVAIHKRFRLDAEALLKNVKAMDDLFHDLEVRLGPSTRVWNRGDLWREAPFKRLAEFFKAMSGEDIQTEGSPAMVLQYLEQWKKEEGEFTFNVVNMRSSKNSLAKRKRKGLPDDGDVEEFKRLAANEFGSVTGSTPDRDYLGDKFIDMPNHKGKSREDLNAQRANPLLLIYELDPNYVTKGVSYEPGHRRFLDLAGRGIVVYVLVMPAQRRPRYKGLVNSTVAL